MRIIELRNVKIGAERLVDGPVEFRLTIQDPDTHEVTWLGFNQEVADTLVEQLTGGIRVVQRMPHQ